MKRGQRPGRREPVLDEAVRREVFRTLVSLEDAGLRPSVAREKVGEKFIIDLRMIENCVVEGIEHSWLDSELEGE